LELWFSGLGKVRFEFKGRVDIRLIGQILASASSDAGLDRGDRVHGVGEHLRTDRVECARLAEPVHDGGEWEVSRTREPAEVKQIVAEIAHRFTCAVHKLDLANLRADSPESSPAAGKAGDR